MCSALSLAQGRCCTRASPAPAHCDRGRVIPTLTAEETGSEGFDVYYSSGVLISFWGTPESRALLSDSKALSVMDY